MTPLTRAQTKAGETTGAMQGLGDGRIDYMTPLGSHRSYSKDQKEQLLIWFNSKTILTPGMRSVMSGKWSSRRRGEPASEGLKNTPCLPR